MFTPSSYYNTNHKLKYVSFNIQQLWMVFWKRIVVKIWFFITVDIAKGRGDCVCFLSADASVDEKG